MDTEPSSRRSAVETISPAPHGKIADIEVLRGISVLFVIESHMHGVLLTWPLPWLTHITDSYLALWPGVDLFFAISGFIIARSLIPRLQATQSRQEFLTATLSFWIRRAWRLLPSAWLWLLIILLGAAFFNSGGHFGLFHANYESVVAAMMNMANVHFAYAPNIFMLGASAPYWSLSLEEQFYLTLPVLVFAAGRRLPAALAIVTFAMFALPQGTNWSGVFRLQSILLGVAFAMLTHLPAYRMIEPHALGRSRIARVFCLAIPLFLLASLAPIAETILPYRFDAMAILTTFLVYIGSYGKGYTMAPGRLRGLLVWFGSRSYGLYLVHTPAFCATNELFFRLYPAGTIFDSRFTIPFLAVGFGLMLTLAELNYRFVEQPLRRHGARVAQNFEAKHRRPNTAAVAA